MATVTVPKMENPKTGSDLNSMPSATEEASVTQLSESSVGGGDETKDKSAAELVGTSDADESGVATDIQKKMKRAERFGIQVQLSEEEKRNSRAQRFGTGSSVNGLDSSDPSETLKRKARAERFGIVQSESSEEEAKKKARLARFGSLSKTDPAEEEKKKARAIRFSQPGSGLNTNGNENIEVKTASPGKVGGGT